MTYKAALIGCGYIGSLYANDPKIKGIYTHAGAYTACPKTELVAVCDMNEKKAKSCAAQWKIKKYYTDIKQLLIEQQPEIVSICTTDKSHADILGLLLNTKGIKGIVVEKPLALDVNRAHDLVRLAKEKSVVLTVNYNRRYAVEHEKIKQRIERGDIGRVQKVSGYYTKGILHNGTHWLDLARYLIGEITEVQGFNTTHGVDQDPEIDAWLQFENGATGFLQNLDSKKYSLFEMDILGTQGRICITHSGHQIEFFDVCESEYYSGYKTLQKHMEVNDNVSNTLLQVIENIVFSIENKTTPHCSGSDGVAVLEVAHALIQSIQSGVRININSGRKDAHSVMHPLC